MRDCFCFGELSERPTSLWPAPPGATVDRALIAEVTHRVLSEHRHRQVVRQAHHLELVGRWIASGILGPLE